MNWRADREKTWREVARRLQAKPPDYHMRALVLAAHPDDETIGASLLLSRIPESSVVFLTDGAPRDTSLWSAGVNGSREEYAEVRRAEALCALALAGISGRQIFWLGAIDQEAVFQLASLVPRFTELLNQNRPDIVITHPYEGGHPDHDTAALVASLAVASLDEQRQPILLEMTSYHARDGKCVTGEFLDREPLRELCFELNDADRTRKREMMNAHVSQRLVLESFPMDRELLRLAPDYDFTSAPHQGKLWYECMRWPMTGNRWRELVATGLAQFQEHSCA